MQLDLVDGVPPDEPDELALEEALEVATTMVVTFFGFDGTMGLVAFFVGVKAILTPPVPPASPVSREAPPAPRRRKEKVQATEEGEERVSYTTGGGGCVHL